MSVYERAQVATLLERLKGRPRRIVALFGPRQSGKTTIVDQALTRIRRAASMETLYRAADEPEGARHEDTASLPLPSQSATERPNSDWIVELWKHARGLAKRPGGCVLVLDEIQKIPDWSDTVKGLWDGDRGLANRPHVVILGSAPLVIQSGLNESLAGRFAPLRVHHWSLREMAEAFGFDLHQYLFYGGFPGMADLALGGGPDEWRDAILDGCLRPSIERDILALTRVDKPALMKRLVDLSSHYSGQIVSFTKLLGHLQDAGNTTTLARYLDLLEAAGLIAGLSGYAMAPVQRRASPKLLILNTGLMTAMSRFDFAEACADRDYWGHVVETAVGAHLIQTRRPGTSLNYWREKRRGKDVEVDYVVERGSHLLAVEVKSGRMRGAHSGLAEFAQRFPRARSLVVGERGIPLVEFLSEPAERWLTEPWG